MQKQLAKRLLAAWALLVLTHSVTNAVAQQHTLWYNSPAKVWTEALPLGNGKLGAMVYGRPEDELIQLNDATLWSGGPVKQNLNPNAVDYLAKIREALFRGDYEQAKALTKNMQGPYSESYLPMADVKIHQDLNGVKMEGYRRWLNIADAVSKIAFTANGVRYEREAFVSAPAHVMVVRFTASVVGKLDLDINSSSQLRYGRSILSANVLSVHGKAPAHEDPNYMNTNKQPIIYDDSAPCRGMRYEVLLKALNTGGTLTTDTAGIHIRKATSLTLYITAATSFNGYDKCPDADEHQLAVKPLEQAIKATYPKLLANHLADSHRYFDRVSLTLSGTDIGKENVPTDRRLEQYTKGASDKGLEVLYYEYGRYLMISSSRTPGVPANLQGIWNKELRAPWSSNYTTNINTQMNYWPVEKNNLSEFHQPLLDLISELAKTGSNVASTYYHTRGWVTHHNSDIWAMANPVGDYGKGEPKWANWPMGSAWLSRHLWEHYIYTKDLRFLRDTAYPLMKGATHFVADWLVPDGKGHLVTAPSLSPENAFLYGDHKEGEVSVASTMDNALIRDLFGNMLEAQKVLGRDNTLGDSLRTILAKLLPFKVGKHGQLQEWYLDHEDAEPHHRHVSHLYAVYPAGLISVEKTPELANAAKRTLEMRGDESTGWSTAWKLNLWARLKDGNHAYILLRNLLHITRENDTNYGSGGGAYPNLFDAHPPFQIDGNFGGTAGISEMLLQYQDGMIQVLPAIPDSWKTGGSFNGLVAPGGFVISAIWKDGKITSLKVYSRNGGACRITGPGSASPVLVDTIKGKWYTIR